VPFEVRDDLPVYTIGRVVELTGLSARQVRYYEKKNLVTPARTPGRQRLYSRDQVHLLQLVKRLLEEGYTLTNIQSLVQEYGRQRAFSLEDYPSRESFRREERASLYPLTNRARLLEILDRLERRDQERAARAQTAPAPQRPQGRRRSPS
jgi:MerR family glutamine synthetase transcriptional repressor